MPSPTDLLGPHEVATLLGVNHNTAHQWIKRGLLPEPYAIISGVRVWTRAVIETWAETSGRMPSVGVPQP